MTHTGFAEFAGAELPQLLRFASALTGSPDTGGDLVQDVMVKVHTRWRRIAPMQHRTAYLRRMITNEWISQHRRWHTRQVRPTDQDELVQLAGDHSDDPALVITDRAELRHRLATLPPRQRAAVVLRFYVDLDYHDIATDLGCSQVNARALVSRGLAALRRDAAEPRTAEPRAAEPRGTAPHPTGPLFTESQGVLP
ncbi:RNA polymerase sigma factor [Nakamurella aerolata]|uniref:Sigma-70 family RNA polymerase sigma factor n=1 Tax=Nakamurella aerolata TaxID=1656892 RepID=A0A849A9R6_9ACTN|nr:sigma-70 family RNA polymerase sigma factor [Nakamurella aerolata]NNG36343.1 sigma-70 family RNA polymerase sigma factor [Nakamurella aerolata]